MGLKRWYWYMHTGWRDGQTGDGIMSCGRKRHQVAWEIGFFFGSIRRQR